MLTKTDWFDDLVRESRHRLQRFVGRYFSSPHDIQDVVQESYLRLYSKLGHTNSAPDQAHPLLYTIAKNLAISRLRHRAVMEKATSPLIVAEELRRTARSAEDQASKGQELRELLLVVNCLPPKCREVFVQRMVHGLSQRAISEKLNISVSTVEKHLAKGLRYCRKTLRHRAEEEIVRHREPQLPKAGTGG